MKARAFAALLTFAAPALAQVATGTPATDGTMATPSTAGAPSGQPMGQTPAAPAPTVVTAPSDPKALIASEFPSYDKDASGTLDKTEFGSWMMALRSKSGQPPMSDAASATFVTGAFATADKDKSKSVSLVELQNYLTGGA